MDAEEIIDRATDIADDILLEMSRIDVQSLEDIEYRNYLKGCFDAIGYMVRLIESNTENY